MIVQVDERTDLLGYQLQCRQCHTNLTLGSQNQLSFQYLLHSGATVFSVSSVQSVTLRLFLPLSGLLQKNSLWLNSQQTAEFSSQALFLGLLAFPPGLRQSARARFRYRPDLFQSVRPLPSACITCSFRLFFFIFFLFFFLSAVWLKRRVCPAVRPLLQRLRQLLLLQCLCQSPHKPHVSPATRLRRCPRTSTRRMSTDGRLG